MKLRLLLAVLVGLTFTAFAQNEPALDPQRPQREAMERLLFGKTEEAIAGAADFLRQEAKRPLDAPADEASGPSSLPGFSQFLRAYGLGDQVLGRLSGAEDARVAALLLEHLGRVDEAKAKYRALGTDEALARLALLSEPKEAEAVMSSLGEEGLALIGQRYSQQAQRVHEWTLEQRLEFLATLSPFVKAAAKSAKVEVGWIPGVLSRTVNESNGDVSLPELYSRYDYRYSYNSPAQEERARRLTERRRETHDMLCQAMLANPRLATDGFKRLAALAGKEGARNDRDFAAEARFLLLRPAQSAKLLAEDSSWSSQSLPLLGPAQYLVKQAIPRRQLAALANDLAPELERLGEMGTVRYLRAFQKLEAASPDAFVSVGQEILRESFPGCSGEETLKLAIELGKTVGRSLDVGPLILTHLEAARGEGFNYPDYLSEHSRSVLEKNGTGGLREWIDQVGAAMVAPKAERQAYIAEHDRPNQGWTKGTPQARVQAYRGFLSQLCNEFSSVLITLEVAEAEGLLKPNDFQLANNVGNTFESYRFSSNNRQSPSFLATLAESPWMKDLPEFRPYRLPYNGRQTLLGHMAVEWRELDSGVRRQIKTNLEAAPNSLGRAVLLAMLESNGGKRNQTISQLIGARLPEIEKLPTKRQEEFARFLQDLHDAQGDLTQMPGNLDQAVRAWASGLAAKLGASALDEFLSAKSPIDERGQSVMNSAGPMIVAALPTDPDKAAQAFRRCLELARVKADPEHGFYVDGPGGLASMISSMLSGNMGEPPRRGFLANLGLGRRKTVTRTEPLAFAIAALSGDLELPPNYGAEGQLPEALHSLETAKWPDVLAYAERFGFDGKRRQPILLMGWMRAFSRMSQASREGWLAWAAEAKEGKWSGVAEAIRLAASGDKDGKGRLAEWEKDLAAWLDDEKLPMSRRLALAGAIFGQGTKAPSIELAKKAVRLCEVARKAQLPEADVTAEQLARALVDQDAEAKELAKGLILNCAGSVQGFGVDAGAALRRIELAAKAGVDVSGLARGLPNLGRLSPDVLPSLVRQGHRDAARECLTQHLTSAIPQPPARNRGGRYVTYQNGSRVIRSFGNDLEMMEGAPASQATARYDSETRRQTEGFVQTLTDPTMRYYAEVVLKTLPDPDRPDPEAPNRENRFTDLAKRFAEVPFPSSHMKERCLAWLLAGSDPTRAEPAPANQFNGPAPRAEAGGKASSKAIDLLWPHLAEAAKNIDQVALAQWNDFELKSTRLTLLRAYLENGFERDPAGFSEQLRQILSVGERNPSAIQQALESYCRDIPAKLMARLGSMTKTEAEAFLPALRALCALPPEIGWSQRSTALHANLACHVLAERGDELTAWLNSLEPNLRETVEYGVEPGEMMPLLQAGLAGAPAELRGRLVSEIFGHPLMERRASGYDNLLDQLIAMNLLTNEEALRNGPAWAEAQPRGGAAHADLARIQARTGKMEEALNSWIAAVSETPPGDDDRYARHATEALQHFVRMGRLDAAMDWAKFIREGNLNERYSSGANFLRVYQDAKRAYLRQPGKDKEIASQARARLESDSSATSAWRDLAEMLAAKGSGLGEAGEGEKARPFLLVAYFAARAARGDGGMAGEEIAAIADGIQEIDEAMGHKQPAVSLVARGASWRHHYAEQAPPESWKNPEFDDGKWGQGAGPLGYGDKDEATVLTYTKKPNGDRPITAYFRHAFEADPGKLPESLFLNVLHDDGVVIYLNGREVARNNMPEGPPEPATLASSSRSEEVENEYWATKIPAAVLRRGVNVVAAEVHQNKANSSDLGFDLEMQSGGLDPEKLWRTADRQAVTAAFGDLWDAMPRDLWELLARANGIER